MRLIVKFVWKHHKHIINANKQIVKNFVRNLSTRVVVLDEQTLTGRILHYLNNNDIKSNDPSTTVAEELLQSLSRGRVNNLHRYKNQDLLNVCGLLFNNDQNREDSEHILNELGLECCIRLNELEPKEVYKILSLHMKVVPHKLNESKFYQLALDHLCEQAGKLSKDDLIQLIFFIGQKKRSTDSNLKIRRCLKHLNGQYINDLTTEDLCIVCNASFKTSTKISNKLFLDKVRNYLNDNLYILKDPALFVTLIKTIRHNRYQDDNLLATISCAIFFNKTLQYYSFPALCHILALFSDHLYYDEVLCNVFVKKCMDELKKFDFSSNVERGQPRFKDIKRFIWAMSNLNYPMSKSDIKDVIIPQIVSRIYLGETRNDEESLIEIILYLWMMDYRAYELVPHALVPRYVDQLRKAKSLGIKRLNLLLSCIYFEDREFFKTLGIKLEKIPYNNPDPQIRKRPSLTRVLDNLKYLKTKLDINKFEITYQVPYLNILGITGYRNNIYKAVYIEILDSFTCVKNKDCYPIGLMQMKLRILEKMDEALIVIPEMEIDGLTEAELSEYLLTEIKFAC